MTTYQGGGPGAGRRWPGQAGRSMVPPTRLVAAVALVAVSTLGGAYAFGRGLAHVGARYDCALVGGDTVAAPCATISVTVVGETQPAAPGSEPPLLRRSAGRVGDALWRSATVPDPHTAPRTCGTSPRPPAFWFDPRAACEAGFRTECLDQQEFPGICVKSACAWSRSERLAWRMK